MRRLKTDQVNNKDKMTNDEDSAEIKTQIFPANIYEIINNIYIFTRKTIVCFFKISGIYLLWICLHYFSSHLYIKFCVPDNMIGFIMSPFMVATPHCKGLRWVVYNAAGIIDNMWILIGASIYSFIWIINKEQANAKPSS